jgi:hypothetical protein
VSAWFARLFASDEVADRFIERCTIIVTARERREDITRQHKILITRNESGIN